MNSAAATAVVNPAGGDRFFLFVKYVKSKSEPELAESSDEESSPRERGQQWAAKKFGEGPVSEVSGHRSVNKFFQEIGF